MLRMKDIPACTCKHADRHSQNVSLKIQQLT